jgi:hypothetical protein
VRRGASIAAMRILALLLVLSARAASAQSAQSEEWAAILRTYASDDGFRYAALHASAQDRARLSRVVRDIGAYDPASLAPPARLAFHIDAYNALVVHAVIERWPVESVMRVPGFFDRVRHRVAGRDLTLNELEAEIVRGAPFHDPRAHFALNCASRGCPGLATAPYSGSDLEARLVAQTRAYVRRTTRVERDGVVLSRIFEWYAGDFPGGVRAFVGNALGRPLPSELPLRYSEYDWALNARP